MSRETKVWLKSSDGKMFEVDEAVAHESQTLKSMIEDMGVQNPIPLPMASSKILAKIIQYCKYHVEAVKSPEDKTAAADDEIKRWDQEFIKVDKATLLHLIVTAHKLNIKKLLELSSQTMADIMIQKMGVEEVRETFHIKNDYIPEEEAEYRIDGPSTRSLSFTPAPESG